MRLKYLNEEVFQEDEPESFPEEPENNTWRVEVRTVDGQNHSYTFTKARGDTREDAVDLIDKMKNATGDTWFGWDDYLGGVRKEYIVSIAFREWIAEK